jgi:hypothetical protein
VETVKRKRNSRRKGGQASKRNEGLKEGVTAEPQAIGEAGPLQVIIYHIWPPAVASLVDMEGARYLRRQTKKDIARADNSTTKTRDTTNNIKATYLESRR